MADQDGGDRQDPRITARLVEILAQAPILFERLNAVARSSVAPGSAAAVDASTPLGHHALILATDHLSTGIEHLVMWHQLLVGGAQPNAVHMTLIRGAMEGAVICRWLVDPQQTSAERVRRGVALLLEDYGHRRDFERDFGVPPEVVKPPAKSAADRIAQLKEQRDEAGLVRMKVPSMTDRFGAYTGLQPGPGKAIYGLLSAYAHGSQWKGMTAKFEVMKGAVAVPGGKLVKVTANDDLSLNLTTIGMITATRALNELDWYCRASARRP